MSVEGAERIVANHALGYRTHLLHLWLGFLQHGDRLIPGEHALAEIGRTARTAPAGYFRFAAWDA